MGRTTIDHPLIAVGARRWIIELPRPGDGAPGRLILNPSDQEVSGFTMLRLVGGFREQDGGGLYDSVYGCLRNEATRGQVCGPVALDTGAFSVRVLNASLPAWAEGGDRTALAAALALAAQGIEAAVVDARFVKPLDEETICGLAAQARRVVTVEENALAGGFGSACLEAFERAGLVEKGIQVKRLGIPDAFITHGDAVKQRAEMGIDAAGIAAAARALVGDRTAAGRSAG